MALPIKETPVLTGRDAVRFIKKMHEADSTPVTAQERKEYRRARKLYDQIRKKNKAVF